MQKKLLNLKRKSNSIHEWFKIKQMKLNQKKKT